MGLHRCFVVVCSTEVRLNLKYSFTQWSCAEHTEPDPGGSWAPILCRTTWSIFAKQCPHLLLWDLPMQGSKRDYSRALCKKTGFGAEEGAQDLELGLSTGCVGFVCLLFLQQLEWWYKKMRRCSCSCAQPAEMCGFNNSAELLSWLWSLSAW